MASNATTTTAAIDAQFAATVPVAVPATLTTPAVPAGVNGDGAAVFGAVAAVPDATIPALATATGLTRAVVKNALAELVTAGHVTRAPGAKGASTDTWSPVHVASSDGTPDGAEGEPPAIVTSTSPNLGEQYVSEVEHEPSAYIVLPLGEVPLNTAALVDEAED